MLFGFAFIGVTIILKSVRKLFFACQADGGEKYDPGRDVAGARGLRYYEKHYVCGIFCTLPKGI